MAPEDPNPLRGTTFILHKISPLYMGGAHLDDSALEQHAKSLRDILAGEVLRGVRVGLGTDEDTLARVGALQTVTWRFLDEQDQINFQGISIEVAYEKIVYTAILLRPLEEDSMILEQNEFEHFPLLLTRMSPPLRDTLLDFLATTFDARISKLHLPKAFLSDSLETYIQTCSEDEDIGLATMRDVQIMLGFKDIKGLSSLDIVIDGVDFPRMVASGAGEAPFRNALNKYAEAHLALDLANEKVKLLRITCGLFLLSSDGKIKITDMAWNQATEQLVSGLVQLAKGG